MNKNSAKIAWKVALINLRNIKTPYFVTALVMSIMFVQTGIGMFLATYSGVDMSQNGEISAGNYLFLLIILAAAFIPGYHFSRILNLGGKKQDFFLGGLIAYALLALGASFANTIIYLSFDAWVIASGHLDGAFFGGVVNLMEVFGWTRGGIVPAFFRQAAFMFLLATFIHVFAAAQGRWYGWAASIGLVAIIAVFTPIASLRAALAWFFRLVIFHQSAVLQILACVALGLALYALSRPIIARKSI
ncbi:MAG: hypothetical protein FWE09_09900 [Treponema sp.]|nr:hypothetical protein [Treponema sp.]